HAFHHGVRPGEVDIFEDAEAFLLPVERFDAVYALVVDDDDLPRLDVADEVGADDVQRAGFAGQDPAASAPIGRIVADAAQDQRPHAERIAHAHQGFVGKRDQGVGADHLLQRIDQPVHHGGIQADGDQVDKYLGV